MNGGREIIGYEGRYIIFPDGRVWSDVGRGRWLRPRMGRKGYLSVMLYLDGSAKFFAIHRLVAIHFVDGYIEGLQVNHINGDKVKNNDWNLEWVTNLENKHHSMRIGLHAIGSKHASAKLIEQDIPVIRERLASGHRNVDIASDYGVAPCNISSIKAGRIWKHVKS